MELTQGIWWKGSHVWPTQRLPCWWATAGGVRPTFKCCCFLYRVSPSATDFQASFILPYQTESFVSKEWLFPERPSYPSAPQMAYAHLQVPVYYWACSKLRFTGPAVSHNFFHACAIGQHRNASTCFHASLFAGIPGSDYINANYIDGYRKQNAYIATQGALPETFGDFWRMMWEQRGATVVMMTKLEERSRVRTTYTMLIVSYLSNHLHKVFASVLYVCLLYMHKNWFFF